MLRSLLVVTLLLLCTTNSAQTTKQIEYLQCFAEAYGVVKYFHPSNEAAELDWDAFAQYGSTQVINCQDDADFEATMRSLFEPICAGCQWDTWDSATLIPKNIKEIKHTYWQHQGLGDSRPNSPYSSVRVGAEMESMLNDGFANIMSKTDAYPFLEKQIKVTAKVRVKKGSVGNGRLWLRVDNQDGSQGFFDNMANRPIVSDEWKNYELVGKTNPQAKQILFGSLLLGSGTLEVDDLTLYVLESGSWQKILPEKPGFENGKFGEFKTIGKGFSFTLEQDEAQNNRFARIAFVGKSKKYKGKELFESRLKLGEHNIVELPNGTQMHIPLVLPIASGQTFPVIDSTTKQGLNKILESWRIDDNQLGYRLGNMVIVYNVFQHFYPYFKEVGVDWDFEFEKALRSSFTDTNRHEHWKSLELFTAALKDGHVGVYGSKYNGYLPPISWEWVQDELVITKVFSDNLAIKIGDIVQQVNGVSPKTYFKDVEARISAATKGYLDYKAKRLSLIGDKDSSLELQINGKLVKLKRDTPTAEKRNSTPKAWYRNLGNDIHYLNLDVISKDSVQALMPVLKTAKGIICDLRGYPNGNHNLIRHLLKEKDTTKGWMRIPQIAYPNQKGEISYDLRDWGMHPAKPYLGDKNVVFIIDGRAISYAESYMGYIEGYDLATIIGQPTAGTNGNVNMLILPGDFRISWTGMNVVKHDGSQHHGIGILPDIYLERTIKGIREGRDEFLEKAIELAKQ